MTGDASAVASTATVSVSIDDELDCGPASSNCTEADSGDSPLASTALHHSQFNHHQPQHLLHSNGLNHGQQHHLNQFKQDQQHHQHQLHSTSTTNNGHHNHSMASHIAAAAAVASIAHSNARPLQHQHQHQHQNQNQNQIQHQHHQQDSSLIYPWMKKACGESKYHCHTPSLMSYLQL